MNLLDRGGHRASPQQGWSSVELASTAALMSTTLAAAVGMGRLFDGLSYLAPVVLAALVSHALSWFGRRHGVSLAATTRITLVVLVLITVWVVLPGTTWHGVPGPATVEAALRELRQARALFADVVAPAPVTQGFLVAGMLGVGAIAFLADWAAFRLTSLFQALLPSFLLVVFTALFGQAQHRTAFVLLYLVAAAAFLLVHPNWLQRSTTPWLADRSWGELRWRLPTGTLVGGAGLVAGVLAATSLAGADSPAGRWHDRGRDRETTVSPLVDIRGRLASRSDDEVFTVRSGTRSYWRLTSLDTFDGQVWSSDARYVAVAGRLPAQPDGEVRGERVVQQFTISSLSSTWLPVAYLPRRVDGVEGLRYNDELHSLVGDERTTRGLTYLVTSSVPRIGADELLRAAPPAGRPQPDGFLRLPPIAPRVRQLAAQITNTAGGPSTSPYLKALALQNFFRQGFAYDLGARPGHDQRALENFLLRDRRGYCEQFAGAYAVLARSMGLPTRVAVGFTPGELGADGLYHVRGINAHAWPEVHFDGFGWVAFEPTPGRGAPGASYTGVPEAQARPDNPATATTAAPTPTTVAPPATVPALPEDAATPASSPVVGRSALTGVATAFLVAAALALALVAVPLAKRARRRRRRRAAITAGDLVLVAWAEAAESLAQAGAFRQADETLDEHARRAPGTAHLPEPAAAALAQLAEAAAAASYQADPVEGSVATKAVADATTVEKALVNLASRPERLWRALDPRPLRRKSATPVWARPRRHSTGN